MDYINSLENSTIKKIKKLKIKKYREEEQLFIAEGRKFLDFPFEPEIIIFRESYEITEEIQLKLKKFQCRKIVVSEKVFTQLTSQENSQGVIIIYPYIKGALENLQKNVVVLDKIGTYSSFKKRGVQNSSYSIRKEFSFLYTDEVSRKKCNCFWK